MKDDLASKGFSTLELVLSLALSSLIVSGTLALFFSLTNFSIEAEIRTEADYGLIRIKEEIAQIIAELDSNRLNITPRLHKAGKIKFTDGSFNPIMSLSPSAANYPATDADAVTSVAVRVLESHKVKDARLSGSHYIFLACPRWKKLANPGAIRSFVAFSADGSFELTGGSDSADSSGCRNFSLLQQKSMSLNNSGSPLNARILIPIERQYTLYVGSDRQLRYLGHAGASNIENQPLLEGVELFQVSLKEKPLVMSVFVKMMNGKKTELSQSALFAREEAFNFIFNFN